MRTGPGVSYKVISMLPSGSSVKMIQYGKEWAKVQTAEGKEGWVLSRYMTKEMPVTAMVKELQEKNKQLSDILEQTKSEDKELSVIREKLLIKEKEYNELKNKSSNFLEMEQKYNDIVSQLEEYKILIEQYSSKSNKEILYSFSIGAGVLIIGIILGMSAKRQSRDSFLM
ncbi:MAG: TIGR04211 family SH3 domain-containing protein [Desulfamplus sp.]|nr:TIGR04211 family SH3 domain-containing protein [Desulfamplus sp.]